MIEIFNKKYSSYLNWFKDKDKDFAGISRWFSLSMYLILMWWLVEKMKDQNLGSHLQNSIAILGLVLLTVLPRKYWYIVLVVIYLLFGFAAIEHSYVLVYGDHRIFLSYPIEQILSGQLIYHSNLPERVPYFPLSSLIYLPYWLMGYYDIRPILIILTCITSILIYRAISRKPESLLIMLVFLFNGFIFESNIRMFVANASFVLCLYAGLYAFKKNSRSFWVAIFIGLATCMKQQAVLIIPFLTFFWLQRKCFKQIAVLFMVFALCLFPFILQNPNIFIEQSVFSFTDYYPNFHYNYQNSFWRWDKMSIHNIIALFPSGVETAWAHRNIPINILVFIIGMGWFLARKRTANDVLYFYVVFGSLYFFFTLGLNEPIYFLFYLFALSFINDNSNGEKVKNNKNNIL